MFNSGTWRRELGRIWMFVLIGLGIFCTQLIFFLLNSLDEKLTEEAKKYQNSSTAGKCNSLDDDPLAISALARMRTAECKWMLKHRLCSMDDFPRGYWPVEEVQNNCHQYFNKSRQSTGLGCFHDSIADRLLKQHRFTFPTTNSPELCVQNCLRAGFHLAGVGYGKECFCGSTLSKEDFNTKLVEHTMCEQYKCPGDDFAFCGGFEAVQVYRTGVQGRHNQKFREFRSIDGGKSDHSKIKILFLFQLNGRNSRQIRRLLRMIYNPKHLYLVHVDSRQHYMFSEMLSIGRAFAAKNIYNFRVFQYRLATIWGGTSLLELFLLTIAETTKGLDQGWRQWDYLLNLSELDMPLLSLEELEHNLASANGMSFLSSHGYNTASFLHKQGFNFHFMECEQRMWRIGTRTGFPRNLRLDGGSDWVVIHRELAEFAISTDKLASQLRLIFSTILLPLESFFHTILYTNSLLSTLTSSVTKYSIEICALQIGAESRDVVARHSNRWSTGVDVRSFHDSDHSYVFRNPVQTAAGYQFDGEEQELEQYMAQCIGNFVKNGDPSTDSISWEPIKSLDQPDSSQHMVIDGPRPRQREEFDKRANVHFWEQMRAKYPQWDLVRGKPAAEKAHSLSTTEQQQKTCGTTTVSSSLALVVVERKQSRAMSWLHGCINENAGIAGRLLLRPLGVCLCTLVQLGLLYCKYGA